MFKCFIRILPSFLIFFLAAEVHAMRCDGKIISEGEYQFNVLARCGAPAYKRKYTDVVTLSKEVTIVGNPSHPDNLGKKHLREHSKEQTLTRPIEIEEWVYNFGPNKLLQILTFVEGKLEKIESGGYGTKTN